MKRILPILILLFLLSAANCRFDSTVQMNNQSAINSQSNATENAKVNSKNQFAELTADQYPNVLYGTFFLHDARKNLQQSLDVSLRGEDVAATINRGFAVNLPPVGAIVKMDIVNCDGYLGTAAVKYVGKEEVMNVWTAELIEETKISGLEEKLLQCVDKPNDEFTRKYLSNSVYFIAPADGKRKQIKNVKNPNWQEIASSIPYEWRKIAKMPMFPTKKQAEACFADWLDSDGDGEIDILVMCAVNEESITESGGVYVYSRVLRKINGSWREIWQTVDTKD